MNNLFKIILQSWQVARRSKLLWIFSFVSAFTNVFFSTWGQGTDSSIDPDYYLFTCLRLILAIFHYFMLLLSAYALPYCAGMSVQEKEYTFKDVWSSFKVYFLKFLLLGIFCIIYIIMLMTLNHLLWLLLARMIENINSLWRSINLQIIFILYSVPVLLSSYGLLFQHMGAFESFKNGFKVFSSNRIQFTLIYAISNIPYFAIGLVFIAILIFNGQAINLENYINVQKSSVYFDIASSFFYFITTPIITAAFALSYFKISPTKV